MRNRRIGYVMAAAGVVVAFNFALPASAALTVEHFWHTGEDNQVLPTDSVGAKPFTGGFGTMAVDAAIFAPGSTKSVSFAADGGSYMDSLGDGITVPSDNWVYELWARPTTTNGASITTL